MICGVKCDEYGGTIDIRRMDISYYIWPSSGLGIPWDYGLRSRLRRFDVYVIEDVLHVWPGSEVVNFDGAYGWQRQPTLPAELYLRELHAIDLSDPKSIKRFVQRFGPLGITPNGQPLTGIEIRNRIVDLSRLRVTEAVVDEGLRAKNAYDIALGSRGLRFLARSSTPLRTARSNRQLLERYLHGQRIDLSLDHEGAKNVVAQLAMMKAAEESVQGFAIAAGWLVDLTNTYDFLRTGREIGKWNSGHWMGRPASRYDAARLLERGLDALLSPLSPRMDVQVERSSNAPRFTRRDGTTPANVPLMTLLAAQLFEHVSTEAEYNVCMREKCRARYVHHTGRAEQGQHRSQGVMYCSKECAGAKATADSRARRNQAK